MPFLINIFLVLLFAYWIAESSFKPNMCCTDDLGKLCPHCLMVKKRKTIFGDSNFFTYYQMIIFRM